MIKCLQEFGHHDRLATHGNFKTFVKSAGIDFYPFGDNARVLAGCKKALILNLCFMCDQIYCTVLTWL